MQFWYHLQSKKWDTGLFTSLDFALFIKGEIENAPNNLAAGVKRISLVQRVTYQA